MHRLYTVRRGDTLTKIAVHFGTTVNRLVSINPQITRPDLIFPGEIIRIR